MFRFLKKSRVLCITVLMCASFLMVPGPAITKPLFVGKEGTFIIHDVGTSRVKRIAKEVLFASINDPQKSMNNMYMSIEFDLVIKDVSNLVEPEGLTFIHLPHFDDKNVMAIEVQYLIKMYDQYRIVLTEIGRAHV